MRLERERANDRRQVIESLALAGVTGFALASIVFVLLFT